MGGRYNQEPEEHENHERYLVTYSDLITLLLALFIIMYSMASMDAKKFEQVSAAMADVFSKGSPDINVGNPNILDGESLSDGSGQGAGAEQQQIDNLESKISDLVNKYGLSSYITVSQEERGLDIEIQNEMLNVALFESGSADLNPAAVDIIVKIGKLLGDLPNNYVRVEGHTDNIPINSVIYESNWELSTNRATNVVKLLINSCGLDPTKLSAVGYGEYKPEADNSTPEGRAKNRRVNIVILRNKYSAVEKVIK